MEEEDFTKSSVEDRCVHKSWKARVSGYEAAATLFRTIEDEKSPEWNKYIPLVKKFVVDSNAPAQEKGLDAVLAFVENCASAGKAAGDVLAGVIQKCIAAPKARTKELGGQICLMYIEIEKHEVVVEELFKGTENKNPKISQACIQILTQALREFGPKVVVVGKLIKRGMPLLEDRDKSVRDATKQMLAEAHRWIGDALKSQLSSLKPALLKELDDEISKVQEAGTPARPTRFLKSEQAKQIRTAAAAQDEGDDDGDAAEVVGEEVDPYELIEPKDILSTLPKNFYLQLEAKKWSERKEVLEGLEKTLNETPKIESADYGELMRALKKVISKDSNVVVVCIAIRCVSGIAKGLKKKFQPYAIVTMQALFEKFKEKKQNVVVALREATDHVYVATTLEQLQEEIITNLDNKNPTIKSEVALFLARCFTKAAPAILNKKLLKAIVPALLKSLAYQDPTVRDSSAQALGTAMKVVGERLITPFFVEDKVDNQKMAKIKEFHDKAVLLVKPAKAVKAKEAPAQKPSDKAPKDKIVRPKPKEVLKNKKKVDTKPSIDVDAAMDKAKALVSEDLLQNLDQNDPAAWNELLEFVIQADTGEESDEILMNVVCLKPAGEATDEIIAIKLAALSVITNRTAVHKDTIVRALPSVISGYGSKTESVSEVMGNFLKSYDQTQLVEAVLTNPHIFDNPKLLCQAVNWVTSQVLNDQEYAWDTEFLEERGKRALKNEQTRNAGLALIGIKHSLPHNETRLREGISKCTSDSDVAIKFAKEESEPFVEKPTAPTKSEPRVDIGNQITEQMMKELADKNWKVRQEVVTKLQGIISANPNITGNLGEAPTLIAARLTDSNVKIAGATISLVESLHKAMGPTGRQHVKTFLPSLLKSIGDPKAWIKGPALSCLNTIGETCGYKEFFENEMIPDALKSGSPATRAELWSWLAEKLPNIPPKSIPLKDELTACLPVLYNNLEDRNAEVRKAANDAVLGIMIHLGPSQMNTVCENLIKGSNVATIKAILDKTRGLLPEKPSQVTKSKSQSSIDKGGAKSAVAKMAPGTSATITKPSKNKPASAPPSRSTGRKKEDDVDMSPLLKVNTMKHQRVIDEQKLKTIKWNFNTPRAEFVELLRDQMMTAGCNKNLIANMFHADFKYHLKAIESLNEELPSNVPGLVSNLDLVLRWMTLRFFDTNPSVIAKGLEYLKSAFTILKNDNYTMLDSEASAFIPYLLLKCGDPKAVEGVQRLFECLKDVYPVSRLFVYVMEGSKSKNSRQRAACLDVLNSYIETYGVSVCSSSLNSVVRDLAKHFTDRDSAVRSSAMKTAISMYAYEGERFIQLLNQHTDKDGTLIEERIRKGAKNKPVASVKPMAREQVEVVDEDNGNVDDDYMEPEDTPASPPHAMSPPQAAVNITPTRQISAPSSSDRKDGTFELVSSSFSSIATHENTSLLVSGVVRLEETPSLESAVELMDATEFRKSPLPRRRSLAFENDEPLLNQEPSSVKPDFFQTGPLDDGTLPGRGPRKSGPLVNSTPLPNQKSFENESPSFSDQRISPYSAANFLFDENVIDEVESIAPTVLPGPKLTEIDLHFLKDCSVPTTIKPIRMPNLTATLSNFAQPTAIKWELAQIASSDIDKAMKSMDQINTVLNSEKKNHLISFADHMAQQLVHQLIILNQSPHPEVVNCYRANFAMLTKMSDYPELCVQITEPTLYKVLEQLLSLLAESKLETLERQDMFRRVVNNVVLKLLENADKTSLICALINMLGKTMDSPVSGHYNDLCVKCLWKLNRAQPKWDKELNYVRLLQEYQRFLKTHLAQDHNDHLILTYLGVVIQGDLKDYPSAWWKTQVHDVPLRTVKTMLHTMVKLRGAQVRDILTNDPTIPDECELSLYVRKLVKHLKLEEAKESNKNHTANVEKPPMPRLTKEHSTELSEIFRMIGDTAETQEGLKRLFSFMKTHPEAEIQPFLAKGSPVFQNYIRKGLQDLEIQSVKRQLHLSSPFKGEKKSEEGTNESIGGPDKCTDAQRLLSRLAALQEKAGCHDSGRIRTEKVDISKDHEESHQEPESRNEEMDLIKERYARIKSGMSK